MFERLLIANRGEIACRVIRTAARLGIETVAVYSDADARSAHVQQADHAVRIGPAPARESYLRADAILDAASETGAAAIHPGYGFLSENADFARACGERGIKFIGPSPEAIDAMGRKDAGLLRMREAGVPVLPGFHQGGEATEQDLLDAAGQIGFPLLIKPSAGGGGKGMRIVRSLDELRETLPASKREALSAFGDDTLMLERFLERPRHVEVQVFADQLGNGVYLLDRDCSIQRRYQKIIEEAPAPGLPDGLRRRMGESAVAAAKAIGYEGAGTVEFLVDAGPAGQAGAGTAPDSYYFMEMNTRLQVEHPVTEMVLGQDLVEWQLKVATGEPLPLRQEDIKACGHAIEARIYAEDPERDFLPASGRISKLDFPAASESVRVDTGVRSGDEVTVHYDPMIAKLIVGGADRSSAARNMAEALDHTAVFGMPTNLAFLRRVVSDPAFLAEALSTGFIAERADGLTDSDSEREKAITIASVWATLAQHERALPGRAGETGSGPSPWTTLRGFRMNLPHREPLRVERAGGEPVDGFVERHGDRFTLELPGGRRTVSIRRNGEALSIVTDDTALHARCISHDDDFDVIFDAHRSRWRIIDPDEGEAAQAGAGQGELSSPMPAKVIEVMVAAGDAVAEGSTLLVLEAMKMEHKITAPFDAVVQEVHFGAGDMVDEGIELVTLAVKE